jgi:parvulin-like peptidyl-prolyl isomerase
MNRRKLRPSVRAAGLLWLVAVAAGPRPREAAAAPQDSSQLVDGVVAVVGDTAITWTELQYYVFELSQGMPVPEDPEGYREALENALTEKVNETVIYVNALSEGITVSDSEVSDLVDDQLSQARRNFPTEAEFQRALAAAGMTVAEYRIRMTERTRVQLIMRQYMSQRYSRMQPLPVSEAEIRQLFEQQREFLGPRPATVSLRQVLILPRPSEEAELAARERAEQVYSRVQAGEEFAVLAGEFSDDATREQGGLLGWVRQGQLLPEFDEAVFRMRPGQISSVVETTVGYHIIKLERVRGAERLARHILFRLDVTDEDMEAARRLAEEVAVALRDGADPDSLVNQHGDPSQQSALTNYQRDGLPPSYQSELAGASPGDVIGPFLLHSQSATGGGWWVVALIQDINPGGEWTLDDVREQYRLRLQEDKALQKIIGDLREATYIETRLDQFLPG